MCVYILSPRALAVAATLKAILLPKVDVLLLLLLVLMLAFVVSNVACLTCGNVNLLVCRYDLVTM